MNVPERKKIKMDDYLNFANDCRLEFIKRSDELQEQLHKEFDNKLADFLQRHIICRDEEFD